MGYAVVEFHDQTCSVIQTEWMDSTKKTCFFPKSNDFQKMIKKKVDQETFRKWDRYEIKIINDNIIKYKDAQDLAKHVSEFGDTEGEEEIRKQKQHKRKHLPSVTHAGVDFRNQIKKLKALNYEEEAVFSSENYEIGGSSSQDNNNNEKIDLSRVISSETVVEALDDEYDDLPYQNNIPEGLDMNQPALIIEIQKIIDKAKNDIICDLKQYIDIKLGHASLKFEKLKSEICINTFVKAMEKEADKNNLISQIKGSVDATGSYNPLHGKIATLLEFLFEKKFLKTSLNWGELNGKASSQSASSGKIHLVDYPIFYEIASKILDQPATPKEIRNSFQFFFKHRAKKI